MTRRSLVPRLLQPRLIQPRLIQPRLIQALALAVLCILATIAAVRAQGLGPLPAVVPASQTSMSGKVQARLLGSAFEAGGEATVWLDLATLPGWHTYSLNPGDSGLATEVAWTLPPGVEAGPITWPVPIRFDFAGSASHGYTQRALLPVRLSVPADYAALQLPVAAFAQWLVCEEVCIPEQMQLSVTLPRSDVATASHPLPPSPHPLPLPDPVAASVRREGERLLVTLESPLPPAAAAALSAGASPWLFADRWGLINHAAPQFMASTPAGQPVLSLTPGEVPLPEQFEGTLAFGQPGQGPFLGVRVQARAAGT